MSTWTPTSQKNRKVAGQHLYLMQSDITGTIKIGRSTHPEKRLHELQTGSPYRLILLCIIHDKGDQEQNLHRQLARYKLKIQGEWFHPDCINELPDWIWEHLPPDTTSWWQK
jgi:hypothetical protein